MRSISWLAMAAALVAGAASAQPGPQIVPKDADYPGTIRLAVDASDTDRHIISLREVIPVNTSGDLLLLTPLWWPGEHSPDDSDMTKVAGLRISAGGKPLSWTRDPVAVNGFHVTVPKGVHEVVAEFQYLAPVQEKDGLIVHTRRMMDLQWMNESLYPAGWNTLRMPIQVTVTLPKDWQYGSALEEERRVGDVVTFKPLPFAHFIDSPLLAGQYFKRYDMDPGAATPVYMDLVADEPQELNLSDNVVAIHRRVVQESYKLFGAKHYDHYNWLVAVSSEMGDIGLEHHRSSEIGIEPGYFRDVAGKGFGRNIIAHEYLHSWDGKFRRPAGQLTGDFQGAMNNELLWVYEGGTTYWTDVIESRAGLYTFDQRLQNLAATVAKYDGKAGRQWRALQDTVYDPIIANRRPESWSSWQRAEDYYFEGELIWLDADTLIREKTGGKKSLDDFAKGFFGGHDRAYDPLAYQFDDVVKALNDVYPYDWATFLRTRLDMVGGQAPLDGLARAGYRLVYGDTPNDFITAYDRQRSYTDLQTSLGLTVGKDGSLVGVRWDGPAFRQGLTAGMKVIAVNRRAYSAERLKAAITAAKGTSQTIELWVQIGDDFRSVSFDYHDGLRYPRLERIEGTPDLLKPIFGAP